MAQYQLFYSTDQARGPDSYRMCAEAHGLCLRHPAVTNGALWLVDISGSAEDAMRLRQKPLPALRHMAEPVEEWYGAQALEKLREVLGMPPAVPAVAAVAAMATVTAPPSGVMFAATPTTPAAPMVPTLMAPTPMQTTFHGMVPALTTPAFHGQGGVTDGAASQIPAQYAMDNRYIGHARSTSGFVPPTVPRIRPVIDMVVDARYILYTSSSTRPSYVPSSGIVEVQNIDAVRRSLREANEAEPEWMREDVMRGKGQELPILATFEDNPTFWTGIAAVDYCSLLAFLGHLPNMNERAVVRP